MVREILQNHRAEPLGPEVEKAIEKIIHD